MADTGTASEAAGQRAIANTVLRATAEIVGKLASLVLFAVMARELGATGLGQFVFALAFLQIAFVPVEFGFDRYLLRRVAKDRSSVNELFFDIVSLKLALTVPLFALATLVLVVAGYDDQTREVVWLLAIGFTLDVLANTVHSLFLALERGGLLASVVIVQRLATAAMGLAVLAMGYGVVAVAATYSAGAAIGLVMASVLLIRRIGLPRRSISARGWRRLTAVSLPFGLQDVFTVLLFKVDAVILSLMATEAAVGLYGGAYRLLESTFFITFALTGAFAPMYTYLDRNTEPTVQATLERSMKLALVGLVPIALVFGLLAEPLTRLFFGSGLEEAADPLRLLAPVIVLTGIVTLASSLIVSRRNPMVMVWATAAVVVLNVALNVVLIPSWDETGAAAAMLISEVVFLFVVCPIAAEAVGGVRWLPTVAGPLLAGAAMAPPLILLDSVPVAAAAVAAAVYAVVLVVAERVFAPGDVQLAIRIARRWLPSSG